MTLLTERFPAAQPQSVSAGGTMTAGVAPLDPFVYRDPVWCEVCQCAEEFRIMGECWAGRIGFCLGCGEERLVRFTRTEAA
jgi:hypothetical protein